MPELVAGVLDGLAGLNTTALYLLAGLFTAVETSVGIGLLVPGDGVVLLAGTLGMSYRRLVGWSALGAVAWSVLYVGVGAAAGASWRQYGDRVGLAGLAVVAAALAVVLTVRAARSHAQRRQGGGPPSGRVQLLEPFAVDPRGGGRHERHDTAA